MLCMTLAKLTPLGWRTGIGKQQLPALSTPKEATTNEDGIASFSNIKQGEHRVIIAYNNYEGEQTIHLTPNKNTKQFDINITIQTKNILFSKEVITIVGVSVFVVAVLLILLVRAKKKV